MSRLSPGRTLAWLARHAVLVGSDVTGDRLGELVATGGLVIVTGGYPRRRVGVPAGPGSACRPARPGARRRIREHDQPEQRGSQ
jgi:hypothetical protein